MPNPPFFARIRSQVLQLTDAIPIGRVCTDPSIGAHLDVEPRSVACTLARLEHGVDRAFVAAERLPSGLPGQVRPPDAPVVRRPRPRPGPAR
jgi:hypothetical protein